MDMGPERGKKAKTKGRKDRVDAPEFKIERQYRGGIDLCSALTRDGVIPMSSLLWWNATPSGPHAIYATNRPIYMLVDHHAGWTRLASTRIDRQDGRA